MDEEAIQATLQDVARRHYVTPERIVSREMNKYIYAARKAAAKQLSLQGLNSIQIGKVLDRHPTTVLKLMDRIGARSKAA